MLKQPVYINSIASISALGITSAEIWNNYLHENSLFQKLDATKKEYWENVCVKETKTDRNKTRNKIRWEERGLISVIK